MKEEEKQLRLYVSEVIQEALSDYFTLTDLPTQIKNVKSKFRKIKSFFTGDISNLSEEIIEEIEERASIDLPDEIKDKIAAFIKEKFPTILEKTKGDKSKAIEKMKSAVNYTFGNRIKAWIRANEEDEDDDEYYYQRNPRSSNRRTAQPQVKSGSKGKQSQK